MLLNDEQKMIQEMMRNYSQQKLKPTAGLRDKTAQFPAQELKELGELGALGMTVSEQSRNTWPNWRPVNGWGVSA